MVVHGVIFKKIGIKNCSSEITWFLFYTHLQKMWISHRDKNKFKSFTSFITWMIFKLLIYLNQTNLAWQGLFWNSIKLLTRTLFKNILIDNWCENNKITSFELKLALLFKKPHEPKAYCSLYYIVYLKQSCSSQENIA